MLVNTITHVSILTSLSILSHTNSPSQACQQCLTHSLILRTLINPFPHTRQSFLTCSHTLANVLLPATTSWGHCLVCAPQDCHGRSWRSCPSVVHAPSEALNRTPWWSSRSACSRCWHEPPVGKETEESCSVCHRYGKTFLHFLRGRKRKMNEFCCVINIRFVYRFLKGGKDEEYRVFMW